MFDTGISILLKTNYGLEHAIMVRKFETKGRREAYLLETDLGRLVLKLTDPGRPEEIVRSDIGILEYLARFDFPAPRPLYTRDRRLYLPWGERFFYLYHFVSGHMPTPSAPMLFTCGQLLARLHMLPVDKSARVSLHRPGYLIAEICEWLARVPDTPEQQHLAAAVRELVEAFPSFDDLPESLIHTDPYFTNLLEGEDGLLYLIDWEDGGISHPLFDAGYLGHLVTYLPHDRAALGLAGDEAVTCRFDWAQAFLDGYQSVRRLNALERELFPWAARLNFLMYLWDWDQGRILLENYERMKLMEQFNPVWG